MALWLLGEALIRTGNPTEASKVLSEAITRSSGTRADENVRANMMLALGIARTDLGDVTSSLLTLQKAYLEFRRQEDGRGAAKALFSIAALYDRAHDARTALRYYGEAARVYSGEPGLVVAIHNGRGLALLDLRQYARAEKELASAETAARQLDSPFVYAQLMANLAHVRLQLDDVEGAKAAVDKGLAIAASGSADPARPPLLALSAAIAWRRGMPGLARRLMAERFAGVDLDRTILADREAHDVAYRLYRADGNTGLALAHLAALKRLDDQSTAIARSSSAALAAARFDYANQELRIAKLQSADLKRRVAFERSAARTQRLVLLGAVGATLLIILMLAAALWTIRRSRNEVRRANARLGESNEALQHALDAKSAFLATTSHEIRTPLNGILGMTQVLMADRRLDAHVRDRVQVVHGAGVTMRALVDDILDMAKIESGRLSICPAPFQIAAMVAEIEGMWGPVAQAKNLSLQVQIDAPTAWVVADGARIKQIVSNLLSNAIKFTAAGGVSLAIDQAADRLRVVVGDSGIGIPADKRDLIFEKFQQMDASITRRFGGTGLGLAICRELARAMGGDVSVGARDGGGSVFTLDLPVAEHHAAEEARPDDRLELLLVERNPISRATLRTTFDGLGEVAAVGSVAEALACLATREARRVLVDAGSADGQDGLRSLRIAANGSAIFLLTATGDATPPPPGVLVIQRPIGRRALLDIVREHHSPLERAAA